ncbi:hypothetical protein [Desulfatibacillum aliphaticivorans]|uniref:hypothetical protein n=1 Tax=Desulfatibacillum aliphaticivorans TaxID=218208 RepID=UPI00041BCB4A|nr:hypothetical protein [Desulfatibacillum aliphaticivorans]
MGGVEMPNGLRSDIRAFEFQTAWLKILLWISLAYIAIVAFHGYFNHFVDDEFKHILLMRDHGVWGFIKYYYYESDGRFVSFFLMYWMEKINTMVPLHRVLGLVQSALIAGALYLLQKRFLGSKAQGGVVRKGLLWSLCIVETAMVLMIIPYKADVLLCIQGPSVYMTSFYLFVLVLIFLDRCAKGGGAGNLIFAGALSFLAAGCQEIYGSMAIGLCLVFLGIKAADAKAPNLGGFAGEALRTTAYIFRRIVKMPYACYAVFLAFHGAGLAIIALSPGVADKRAFINAPDLPLWQDARQVLINTLMETAKPKLYMIPVLAFLIAWLIVGIWGRRKKKDDFVPNNAAIFGLLVFMNFCLMLIMNVISRISMGTPLAARAYTAPFLFIFLLTVPAMIAVVQNSESLFFVKGKPLFQMKTAANICLILFFGFHILNAAFQVVLIPETLNHHKARLAREALLENPPDGEGPIVLPKLPYVTMHKKNPLDTFPEGYLNQRMVRFYRLDRPVVLEKTPEVKESMGQLIIRAIKNRILL